MESQRRLTVSVGLFCYALFLINGCKLNYYCYICSVIVYFPPVMEDVYMLSDVQLCKRIGDKLKATRLKRNITQQSLAEASLVSLSSLKKIEAGEIGTFDTLLRVLRTLGMLDCIYPLLEEEQLSPNEYYEFVNKSRRHTRKRAMGQIVVNKEESEW